MNLEKASHFIVESGHTITPTQHFPVSTVTHTCRGWEPCQPHQLQMGCLLGFHTPLCPLAGTAAGPAGLVTTHTIGHGWSHWAWALGLLSPVKLVPQHSADSSGPGAPSHLATGAAVNQTTDGHRARVNDTLISKRESEVNASGPLTVTEGTRKVHALKMLVPLGAGRHPFTEHMLSVPS